MSDECDHEWLRDTPSGFTCGKCGADKLRWAEARIATLQERYPGHGHPWADFLHHRKRALVWLRDERKETPEETAVTMSMDPVQVRSILAHADEALSPGRDGKTE
jgi:hypothetical protein